MHTGTYTRIGVVMSKLGSIKTTKQFSKGVKPRLQWGGVAVDLANQQTIIDT